MTELNGPPSTYPAASLLDEVFQASPTGLCVLQAVREPGSGILLDFRPTAVNQAFCEAVGQSAAELLGQTLLTLFPGARSDGSFGQYERVLCTGELFRGQQPYPHARTGVPAEISVSPLGDGVLLNALSVTTPPEQTPAPQAVNAGLLQILDNISLAVSLLNPVYGPAGEVIDFTFEFVNSAAARIRGLPAEQMIGHAYSELLPAAAANGRIAFLAEILAKGEFYHYELEYHADGLNGWFDQGILPVGGKLLFTTTDVSLRKKLELSQQAQTELLQTVIDNTEVGLLLLEPVWASAGEKAAGTIVDFRCQLTNTYNAHRGGKTVADLTGKLIGEVFAGWQDSDLFRQMLNVVESGETQRSVFPYNNYGWEGWYDGTFTMISDRLLYTYSDVTELKKAEERNERQADTFRAVLASTLHGMNILQVILDEAGELADLRYEYVSDQVLRDTGLDRETLIGNTVLTLFPGLRRSRFWDAYVAALKTGEPQQFEEHYHYDDGYDNYLSCQVVPIEHQRVVSMYQTINDLKRAQHLTEKQAALLRSVLDGSQNAIIAFDAVRNEEGTLVDFRFRLQNEANRRRTGYTDDELTGQTIQSHFPDLVTDELMDEYRAVVETGEPFRQDRTYQLEGGKGWYNISVVKRDDGIILTLQDKTAEKLAEDRLLANQHKLQAANLALSRSNEYLQQFAYIASHDLQEPLRKIQSFSDLLQMQYAPVLDTAGLDLLERQKMAAQRMQTLVKDLLAYSRLTSQRAPFQPVSLQALAEGVVNDLETTIRESGATLTVGELPTLAGDPTQLGQLLLNLLTNALKFSKPDEPPHVRLNARRLTAAQLPHPMTDTRPNNWLALEVADNGIGFDETYSERIFEIFHRLHGRRHYVGTGIGLAVVKKVVENHSGFVTAHSRPGEGATFTVYLPLD